MTSPEIFLWGFGGSIAVEIASLYRAMMSHPRVPSRYRNPWFWLVRVLLAGVAGGLALAYEIDNRVLAINVGASAPLILQALAAGVNAPGTRLPPS